MKKNKHASVLGKLGGRKGGLKAASNMTPEQRSERARKAVQVRWGKSERFKSVSDLMEDLNKPMKMSVERAREVLESRSKQAVYEFETDESKHLAEVDEALAVFDHLVINQKPSNDGQS